MATVSVQHHQMFIDGQAVDSDEHYEIRSPATEELVCTIAKGNADHADQAIEAAKRSFLSGAWANKSPDERSDILKEVAKRLGDEAETLIELETSANGATMRQALGFHVGLAAPHFLHFAEQAATYEWERPVSTPAYPSLSTNTIVREPVGVCAAIVPWNFPLLLGIWKIAPALAAGNSIVVKPDEKTPLSLLRLVQICDECGVPAGVINLVTGDGPEVGARLASHPDVDKVAFTGSTAVGREIMRLASQTVKKVSLELGGKGPVVVLPDADLDTVADAALFGCMLFSGQMCESGTRLLVPESIHDDLVARIVKRAGTLSAGDPTDLDTDMGPVISRKQRDRVLEYLQIARDEGATIEIGGGVIEGEGFEKGHWIQPTVITGVNNDMRIAREEIFGPVLCVIPYKTTADAIAIANDTEYGLSAGVWSANYEAANDVARKLRAGTVWVNNWHMVAPALPFGGYKQSGLGREIGPGALDEYTEAKHLHMDLTQARTDYMFDLVVSTPLDA